MPITVAEAIQGATIEVPTLNGTKRIRIPAGTQHGTVQRLRGEGPPKPGDRGRGDILYRLEVEMPRELDRRAAQGARGVRRDDQRPRPARAAAARCVRAVGEGWRRRDERRAAPTSAGARRARGGRARPPPRRVHDLGRRRARRDAPADAAHVRGARADHAEALAEEHPPLLLRGRRAAAADPADDRRGRPQPRRGRDRARRSSASSSAPAPRWRGCASAPPSSSAQMAAELERVRRSLRAEIVPYGAYEPEPRQPPTPSGAPVSDPDRAAKRRRRG